MSDVLRVCARCQVAKPLAEFPIKNAARGTRVCYCRPCRRAYGKQHYRRNIAAYVRRAAARSIVERAANRAFVWNYLLTHPCVDCGEADPIVLEFDHRDPAEKVATISRLIHASTSGKLLAEIARCDVRCGNCHRIRTAQQFGSYRLQEEAIAYAA